VKLKMPAVVLVLPRRACGITSEIGSLKAGKLECVIACYEKDYVLMAQVPEGHLAISVDRDHALGVFRKIILKLGRN
jgi:hypothetical protein